MTIPRRDPYIWIHLAGLATVPLWLDLCLSGLAVGDPVVPPWVELTTLGWVGTVPILWMQLQRPFYIFSIPGLAVRPDKLGEGRRRLLSLQRTWFSRGLVCLSAIALFGALYWLYQLAPIAADMTPFAAKSRSTGWLICAGSFLLANLFVQVPATVIPLLLASPEQVAKTPPYESAAILQRFMVLGLRLPTILPELADLGRKPSSPSMPDDQPHASVSPSAASVEQLDRTVALAKSDYPDTEFQVLMTEPAHPIPEEPKLAGETISRAADEAALVTRERAASAAIAPSPEVADPAADRPAPSSEPLIGAIPPAALQQKQDWDEPVPIEPSIATSDAHAHDETIPLDALAAATAIADATVPAPRHFVTEKAATDIVQSLSEIDVEFADAAPSASSTAVEDSRSTTDR